MSQVVIREHNVNLTAEFDFGRPPWSYYRGDAGDSPRYIDSDVASDLLRRMLMSSDGVLPDQLTLKGASAVTLDSCQNWNQKCYVDIEVCVAHASDLYGIEWKKVITEKMKSMVTRFQAMCATPGGLEWWERRTRLEERLKFLKENQHGYGRTTHEDYMEEVKRIQSDPEFKNIEAPDFIGETLLATKFAELDIAITGKKPQGYKRYPFRFEDIAMSSNLIYLNDGGYSRLGLFLNTDDTLRVLIYMNEKSDHHGRQHDDDVTAKIREIQEAATTWYRQHLQAEEKRAAEDAAERKWREGATA